MKDYIKKRVSLDENRIKMVYCDYIIRILQGVTDEKA
jgi:hypothetical protein